MRRKPPHAFTLVELLVVISIIALLISILLPALQKAREVGKMVVCLSNARQTGIANISYATDNEGTLCPAQFPSGAGWPTSDLENLYWFRGLTELDYTPQAGGSQGGAFMCPSGVNEELGDLNTNGNAPDVWDTTALDAFGDGLTQTSNVTAMFYRQPNSGNATLDARNTQRCNMAVASTWQGFPLTDKNASAGNQATWYQTGGRATQGIPTSYQESFAVPNLFVCDPAFRSRGWNTFRIDKAYLPSECVQTFDGLWMFALDPTVSAWNRISLRHPGPAADFSFLDGHAETVSIEKIPAGNNDPLGRPPTNGTSGPWDMIDIGNVYHKWGFRMISIKVPDSIR